MTPRWSLRFTPLYTIPLLLVVAGLLVSGCFGSRSAPPPPATNTPLALPTVTPTAPRSGTTTLSETATPTPLAFEYEPIAALTLTEAAPPVKLQIPEIDLDAPVTPMGWYITELDGQRTTQWTVPEKSAGWHPNSAGAGAAGNVIISGHQLLGDAVFAPLALGDVLPGQIVLLTDADGRVFVYRVTEVSDPLPISTNLADETVLGRQVMGQTGPPRLTMITGWPDFTTTHRIIVVAEFLGIAK